MAKSSLGLPSWRNNPGFPSNHIGSDNKWQSQHSKIPLFQKWNSLNPKFGHYCVICRPDSLFDRNFWLGFQVAFVDGYSKTLGQNWKAWLLGNVTHPDMKSQSNQWTCGNSSWEAFLLHRSCIYSMVYSGREWTLVLLCQGVWQWESSSGRYPQLPWHGAFHKD